MSTEPIVWTVTPEEAGQRLDHFIADHSECSHAAARRLVQEGRARIVGPGRSRPARKGMLVQAGDQIEVAGPLPSKAGLRPVPEPELPLEVLHVEDDLVVLAKPAGVACHPLRAGERGTLANALVARFPDCADVGSDPREAGLVHRLDRDTSGVLIAARNEAAWHALRSLFHAGQVRKQYLALVHGAVDEPGTIDLALDHDPRNPRRMVVLDAYSVLDGQAAHSEYTPLGRGGEGEAACTLLRVTTTTGRMHQVRAHLAHLGYPLVGDTLYGASLGAAGDDAPGHVLHAERITLPHPTHADETLEIRCPLGPARRAVLERYLLEPLLVEL